MQRRGRTGVDQPRGVVVASVRRQGTKCQDYPHHHCESVVSIQPSVAAHLHFGPTLNRSSSLPLGSGEPKHSSPGSTFALQQSPRPTAATSASPPLSDDRLKGVCIHVLTKVLRLCSSGIVEARWPCRPPSRRRDRRRPFASGESLSDPGSRASIPERQLSRPLTTSRLCPSL